MPRQQDHRRHGRAKRIQIGLAALAAAMTTAGCATRSAPPEPEPLSRTQIYPVTSQCDAYNLNLLALGGAPARTEMSPDPFDETGELGDFVSGDVGARLAPLSFVFAAFAAPFIVAKDLIEAPFAIPGAAKSRARQAEARREFEGLVAAHRAAACETPAAYAARADVAAATARFDQSYAAASEATYAAMTTARDQLRGGLRTTQTRKSKLMQEAAAVATPALNAAGVANPFGGRWEMRHASHIIAADGLVERFMEDGHFVDEWAWMNAVRATMESLHPTYRCGGYSDIAKGLNALPWDQGVGLGWNRVQVKRFFKRFERAGEKRGVAVDWPPRTWPLRQPDLC